MTNKAKFHPYGVVIKTSDGDIILNAGEGMTIFPNGDMVVFSSQPPAGIIANGNGVAWQPPSFSDANASNNSIYYSITANKLVYKDSGAVVHNLY